MVRIGIIGIGFMGMTHFEGAKKLRGGKVTALSSRSAAKLAGDWTSIQGNFGPRGGQVDLSKFKRFPDYHDMLRDPEIDVVDVCLPTDQHEQVVIDALQAGKHVFVEKPIALDLKSAERMVKAATKAGKMLLVAHVLPYFPEFKFAAECVQSGKYGKLRAAHFRRVISKPEWSADMGDATKTGGPGIDLHIHDTHFIGLICGMPKQVHARGIVDEHGFAQHLTTQYLYDDSSLAVSCVSGGIAAKGLAFAHGFEMYFEKATLLYEANTLGGEWVVNRPLVVLTDNGKAVPPKLKGGSEWYSAYTAELQDVVNAIVSGQEPPLLSGQLALDALRLCHLEAQSAAKGKAVTVRG